jgi:CBS domain-containing protein
MRRHVGKPGSGQEEAWRLSTGNDAETLMITDIVVARETDRVADVLARVMQKKRQVVPVVDDTGAAIGIVDRVDLLRVFTGGG